MSNIELTCFDGKMVTPKNDAITLDMIVGQSGIISGCELTFLGANQVLMSECEGLIKGRRFNAPEQTLLCQMSDAGSIPGRIYIRMDLSDTETPIDIITVAAESLPDLECDEDCNYTNGVFEIELATYTANETAITDLVATYSIVSGSDVLDTLEEIEANTSPGKAAGALAVQELNQSLQSFSLAHDALVDALAYSGLGVTRDMTFAEIASILSHHFTDIPDNITNPLSMSVAAGVTNNISKFYDNTYDLTNVKSITFKYNVNSNSGHRHHYVYSDVGISTNKSSIYRGKQTTVSTGSYASYDYEHTIDVNDLSGSYYIGGRMWAVHIEDGTVIRVQMACTINQVIFS